MQLRFRGIYFIDPEDKEFKETIKNARKKLETPMAPAMPCKTCKETSMWKPVARLVISSPSVHVSWTPVNPQECVWNKLYRNIMRTISQEKDQFTTASQYGTQLYSYASSNEDTRNKSGSELRIGKIEKIPAWDKSQKSI